MQEATRQLRIGRLIGPPQVSGSECKLKTRGQHADHGVTVAIECQRMPNDPFIPAEAALPHSIGQNSYSWRARLVFSWLKRAPNDGLNAKHRKEIGRCQRG